MSPDDASVEMSSESNAVDAVDWVGTVGCTPQQALGSLYAARPAWIRGYVSYLDAQYLQSRVIASAAKAVAEIGTSSGLSTAVICNALSLAHGGGIIDGDFEVRTYDIRERFLHDEGRRTGDAAREMLSPELMGHIVFRGGVTAAAVCEDFGIDALALLFIDADHRHPWPTLDLLATLDCLRPGAEVFLHDINLPARVPEDPSWGAKYLFEDLDVEKQLDGGDPVPNIGSIWIPEDKAQLGAQLREIVRAHEWETSVPAEVTGALSG